MRRGVLFILIQAMICFSALSVVAASSENSADTLMGESPAAVTGSADSTDVYTAPKCTLEVTTTPAEVTVKVDAMPPVVSPVTLELDTGKHTIILQKTGYYQKKVVVTLSNSQKTALTFDLSAPAVLSATTIPDSVSLYIDGKLKGVTPYTDSLMKPGMYAIRLEKAPYSAIEDSLLVQSKGVVSRVDTLKLPQAYQDSVAYAAEVADEKKRRFTLGFVGGAFGLFLAIIMLIDGLEG